MATIEEKRESLVKAIGESVTIWAEVEYSLFNIFRWAVGSDALTADSIWETTRMFSGRLKVLNELMKLRIKNTQILADWNLLHRHTDELSKDRNSIVHSTMSYKTENAHVVIEPYFLLSKPRETLNVEQVKTIVKNFSELQEALFWLFAELTPPVGGRSDIFNKTPELMTELRNKQKK